MEEVQRRLGNDTSVVRVLKEFVTANGGDGFSRQLTPATTAFKACYDADDQTTIPSIIELYSKDLSEQLGRGSVISKEDALTALAFFALGEMVLSKTFKVTNNNTEVSISHTMNFCRGCEALFSGRGGENQMMHYGGCMEEESYFDEPCYNTTPHSPSLK